MFWRECHDCGSRSTETAFPKRCTGKPTLCCDCIRERQGIPPQPSLLDLLAPEARGGGNHMKQWGDMQ